VRKTSPLITVLFILLVGFIVFKNTAYAACTFKIDPQTVAPTNNQEISITGTILDCLDPSLEYRVVAYPKTIPIQQLNDGRGTAKEGTLKPPTGSAKPIDNGNKTSTLKVKLDFNAKSKFSISSLLTPLAGIDYPGQWNVSVCLNEGKINQCEDQKFFIGKGTISINSLASAPTPTPASNQPIIDPFQQDACTFRYTEDPNFSIPIKIQNLDSTTDPAINYSWWWADGSARTQGNFTAKDLETNDEKTLWTIKIRGDQLKSLTNPQQESGHLFCIDISGLRRTGANCINLFFVPTKPTQQRQACSQNNSGTITQEPASPLSQCSSWTYPDGTPIPTSSEPNGTQEKFIRDNGLISSGGIKCKAVNTALLEISTEPFGFVKSIMGIVLGVAGGIAVILIIAAGFSLMTSQGNHEVIQDARARIIAAIAGLLFIIFSVAILEIIGVDILHIPGFGK